ncbi:MAG: hypothetical protein QW767_06630, partial [Thermoprotei archaeon]
VQLSEELKARGAPAGAVTAVDPTEPWAVAESEEERQRLRDAASKRARSLKAFGVDLRTRIGLRRTAAGAAAIPYRKG